MIDVHLDCETRSAIDLRKVGTLEYARHSSTDLWCVQYAIGDGEVQLWTPGSPFPRDLLDALLEDDCQIVAFNAAFERTIWREILAPRYGWPALSTSDFRCVMAEGLAMALPGDLDRLAAALAVQEQKDAAGHRLMLQMARPRRVDPDGSYVWWDDEERRQRLYDYCAQDVKTERAVGKRVLRLSPAERRVWLLDQEINDRGVGIDRELCRQSKKVVAAATKALDAELMEVTGCQVTGVNQSVKLAQWLTARGVPTGSVAKDAVEELLVRDDLPPDCQRAIEIRRDGSKSSTAKLDAMLDRSVADGRMRFNLQYHGAGTGRWAARGAQLQNLPRPRPSEKRFIPLMIDTLRTGSAEMMDLLFGSPMAAIADCVRGMIVPDEGYELFDADFANIEGRVLAWLAGEEWKLEAFRDYDRGTGPDLYKVAAAATFDCAIEAVDDAQRQVGKVEELALGYQGGVGAFAAMAKTYRLDMGPVFPIVWETASSDNRDFAVSGWDERGRRSGITRERWIASELVKLAWRQKHPATVQLWRDLENAALEAMINDGAVVRAGSIRYRKNGSFLWCQLPSSRVICYPFARIDQIKLPWGGTRRGIVYKAIDQKTKQWGDKKFYGGLAAENVTQAVARDCMSDAMTRVDEAGYPVVLTVHDEVVCERLVGTGTLDDFKDLMATVPPWATGLPIAVEGWVGQRYKK